MKVKTEDLIDLSLDWAVTVADGLSPVMRHDYMRAKAAANNYKGDLAWHLEVTPNEPITVDEAGVTRVLRAYSEQWGQGGPIIDRMMQGKFFLMENDDSCCHVAYSETEHDNAHGYGPTPLIAACRCFVASHLGDEVDVPEELMKISS